MSRTIYFNKRTASYRWKCPMCYRTIASAYYNEGAPIPCCAAFHVPTALVPDDLGLARDLHEAYTRGAPFARPVIHTRNAALFPVELPAERPQHGAH